MANDFLLKGSNKSCGMFSLAWVDLVLADNLIMNLIMAFNALRVFFSLSQNFGIVEIE
jgi:hypothetical protein